MNEIQYTVGLDIGSSKVKAILGSYDGDTITVLAVNEGSYDEEFESISKGVIANAPNTLKTINETLESLLEGYESEGEFTLNVNICQDSIHTEKTEAEYNEKGKKFDITQEVLTYLADINLQEYSPKEGYEALHALPMNFYRDGELLSKSPGGTTGNVLSCDFLNINIESEKLGSYRKHLNQIKIDPKNKSPYIKIGAVAFSPIAESIAVLSDEDRSEGVLLLNIGHTFSTGTYYEKNALRKVVMLPFGSSLIASDITKKLGVTYSEAEKLQYACMSRSTNHIEINEIITLVQSNGLPSKRFLEKNIASIGEWRLREIAALLNCELDLDIMPKNGIILSGGIAELPGLKALVKKEFNTEIVRVANATQNILGVSPNEAVQPKFGVACGLMLSSFMPVDSRMVGLSLRSTLRLAAGTERGWKLGSTIRKIFTNDDLNQGYAE